MPIVAKGINLVVNAEVCGYPNAVSVDSFKQLDMELKVAKGRKGPSLIEMKCSISARNNLSRLSVAQ